MLCLKVHCQKVLSWFPFHIRLLYSISAARAESQRSGFAPWWSYAPRTSPTVAPYRGISLIRNHPTLGPYRRALRRVLRGSYRGGHLLMGEVPLWFGWSMVWG